MASNKYIVGLFDHEDKLIGAIRRCKKENVEITDTLTPFPVHGLEDELGYQDTRLHTPTLKKIDEKRNSNQHL